MKAEKGTRRNREIIFTSSFCILTLIEIPISPHTFTLMYIALYAQRLALPAGGRDEITPF
jgi:hypothetical protein